MPVQLPPEPVLRRTALARLPLPAGRWLVAPGLEGIPFADCPVLDGSGDVTAVYPVTGYREGHPLAWSGQPPGRAALWPAR